MDFEADVRGGWSSWGPEGHRRTMGVRRPNPLLSFHKYSQGGCECFSHQGALRPYEETEPRLGVWGGLPKEAGQISGIEKEGRISLQRSNDAKTGGGERVVSGPCDRVLGQESSGAGRGLGPQLCPEDSREPQRTCGLAEASSSLTERKTGAGGGNRYVPRGSRDQTWAAALTP